MTIVTVGIDLATNVFAVHGLGESGSAELMRPDVPCARLLERVAGLPPCRIGMEACSGAHPWVELESDPHGATLRKDASQFALSPSKGSDEHCQA